MAVNVVLFKKNKSIISKCIAIVTGCEITHSAVLVDGQLYDASEKRGKFGLANLKKLKKRNVKIYNLGASDEQVNLWLIKNNGKRYDYRGILQWILFWLFGRFIDKLKIASEKKVYCFEATAALISAVTGIARFPSNLHGGHLQKTLGKPVYIGKLEDYLKEFDNAD
jgi:hypothetical protein